MYRILKILILIYCTAGFGWAQSEVIRYPDSTADLVSRWEWAFGKKAGISGGCWIGHSFPRIMNENSHIGSHFTSENSPSLQMILAGKAFPATEDSSARSLKKAAQEALENWKRTKNSRRKVSREVAVLFYFEKEPGSKNAETMELSDMDSPVDFRGKPLIWLGTAGAEESAAYLQDVFRKMSGADLREDLLTAIALHNTAPSVPAFLRQVVRGSQPDDLREQAVFWLGMQRPADIDFLLHTARNDRSAGIREKAVFALSQADTAQATEYLIGLARSGPDREVREQAIFWLGHIASRESREALVTVVYDEKEQDLREQAVFALSQLPDGSGVPVLIKIARSHPNTGIRKKAIFWLSQSEDSRALETIIDLVRQH